MVVPSLLLSACGASPPEKATVVYDSAGVHIAINREPLWRDGEAWQVNAEPLLDIGVVDGPGYYQFSNIARVWRDATGRIVVGDRMASEIRVFGSDGRFLHHFGGSGGGPGEFMHLTALAPYRGDSIVVWDTDIKRLSVFDRDGTLGRTHRIELAQLHLGTGERSFGISETFWGSYADGSLVFSPFKLLRYRTNEEPIFRRPLLRLSAEGDSLDTLGGIAVAELRGLTRPFVRSEMLGVTHDRVYIGGGDRYEVKGWSSAGHLDWIARVDEAGQRVDDENRESFVRLYRNQQRIFNRSAEEIERRLATVVFPTSLPPYSALIVDGSNHLWVEDYRLETDSRPANWRVFDPDGRWLGWVAVPAGFKVHQIGPDYILGVRMAEVPIVESYRLRRSGG